MRQKCIIGFDVGTSSLKAAIASQDTGQILDFYTGHYQMQERSPGVTSCAMYVTALQKALQKLSQSYDITAVSVATQMYSICREIDGEMYVYQWNALWDRNPELEPTFEQDLYQSGCLNDTIFGAYKAATAVGTGFVPYGIKDYLIEYLCGQRATDMTTASSSGLYDAFNKCWNEGFIRRIGLDTSQLSLAVVHNTPIGHTKPGLLPEPAVVAPGLGDGMSASYACRHVSSLCGNLGTSIAVRMITDASNVVSPKESRLWTYAMDERRFLVGGISSNGFSVLHWGKDLGWNALEQDTEDTQQVLFLPWLYGERVPFWSSNLRGTFLGISKDTDNRAFEGALLKSVAFTFSTMVKEMEKHTGDMLVLGGGGANFADLVSVISGCINADIAILDNTDYLASIGAAISAAEAIGITIENKLAPQKIIKPTGRYKDEFAKWRKAATRMAEFYEQQ
ncbi:MAG: FGGY-family carbohydrate kinase [Defluviitaleaceae bacterium]|nr:FGGY-family carbohydrate kinase [Defluviitaleaceae bacterium]